MPLIKKQARSIAMMRAGQRNELRRRYIRAWNQYIVDRETFYKVLRDMYRSNLYSENTNPGDAIWSIVNHLEKLRYASCSRHWMRTSTRRSMLYDQLGLPKSCRTKSFNSWRRKYEWRLLQK